MMTAVALIIKMFVQEVKKNYEDDYGEMRENDFYWSVFAVVDTSMLRRRCVVDEGIVREGQILA